MDRLRSYPHWLATRNLSNEASDESVAGARRGGQGRATSCRAAGTGRRRSCSGSSKLADYDRMAVVGADDEQIGWEEGSGIVLDTFDSVSPRMREIAGRFFDERWIDVPPAADRSAAAPSAPRPCPASTPT